MKTFKKKDFIKYFLDNNQSGYKTTEKHIDKNFEGLVKKINDFVLDSEYDTNIRFTQKLYNYLFNIKKIQKCNNCGKEITWRNRFTEGYRKTCSINCRGLSNERIEKMHKTTKERYGSIHPLQNEEIKNKRIKSLEIKTFKKFENIGYEIVNSNKKRLTIRHPDGHIFENGRKLLINRLYGGYEISTILNPVNSIFSTYENEFKKILTDLGVKYIENSRNLLDGKEIDIYIPKYNLGIEFDGLYWHSNLYLENNYHLNKTNLAEKNNIKLLHVFEDEWLYKKEIVLSIIKSNLEIYDKEISIINCEVKEIDNILTKEFLIKNHIEGFIDGEIKIGLFRNNELISLIVLNNSFEILRYCDKLNTQIIGAVAKLLSFLIRTYKPKSITVFIDRRYDNGNSYKELGFEFIENTEPKYYYVDKNKIQKRHNYRKNVLITEERDIEMPRIYDCGNYKFEMLL